MKVGTDGVLLGAWCRVDGCRSILDVGTGTGLIALMMAQRNPYTAITGVEIDVAAAAEARENVSASPWADRIRIIAADYNIAVADDILGRYDMVVSNPPFFVTDTRSPEGGRAAAHHGVRLGYANLLSSMSSVLTPDGRLALVSPADRENDIVLECELAGLSVSRIAEVFTKVTAQSPSRLLWEIVRRPSVTERSRLLIGSPEYIKLVGDFYLNM